LDKKILDFQELGKSFELWGNLTEVPDVYIEGIAHADGSETVVKMLLYSLTGIVGSSGEIAVPGCRLIVPIEALQKIVTQLSDVVGAFPPARSDDTPVRITPVERSPIGPRIA
jgi:hypothetical protein